MFFLPVELIVNRIHYLIIILICQTLSGIWYSIKPKRDSCYATMIFVQTLSAQIHHPDMLMQTLPCI